jgi:glutaredoxin
VRGPSLSLSQPFIPLPTLTLYTAPGCHLCHDALLALRALQAELGFDLLERDITLDDALHRAYLERIPVGVLEDEELFEYFVDADLLRERLAPRDPGDGGSPR